MSVYIKGMEMPKSCFYCPFRRKVDPDNIMCIVTRECFEETYAGTIETRNRGNCPLDPVPEHGRLIDADAFIERMNELVRQAETDGFDLGLIWYTGFIRHIELAPTIIPAEEVQE